MAKAPGPKATRRAAPGSEARHAGPVSRGAGSGARPLGRDEAAARGVLPADADAGSARAHNTGQVAPHLPDRLPA